MCKKTELLGVGFYGLSYVICNASWEWAFTAIIIFMVTVTSLIGESIALLSIMDNVFFCGNSVIKYIVVLGSELMKCLSLKVYIVILNIRNYF